VAKCDAVTNKLTAPNMFIGYSILLHGIYRIANVSKSRGLDLLEKSRSTYVSIAKELKNIKKNINNGVVCKIDYKIYQWFRLESDYALKNEIGD